MNFLVEKNIPVRMRDGVNLATDVYRPIGDGPFPTLVMRLPYNKGDAMRTLPAIDAVQAGYAVVVQDCRGRFASEGIFLPLVQERDDGVDAITWAASQPWSTGKVGMMGGSYLGITQWLPATQQPEALRAMVPAMTPSDFYNGLTHQGGAFLLGFTMSWCLFMASEEAQRQMAQGNASREELSELTSAMDTIQVLYRHLPLVDIPLLEKFTPFYLRWLSHVSYDGYWSRLAPREHYERVTVPVFHIAGWYDCFLAGVLENYNEMKARCGSMFARSHQRLVIGPWSHTLQTGSFPEREYGVMAGYEAIGMSSAQMRWYDHWLKGEDNEVEQDKPVKLFVMGADIWREEDSWPLPDTQFRPYYLHSMGRANTGSGDGQLSTEVPTEEGGEGVDVYLYDPRRSVPTVGGATFIPGYNVGPRDQRVMETREDVLCYTSPSLEEPVEVTGPVELALFVSSSVLDTDFIGKLVDVYPDGRAEILCDGILRARYRESFSVPRLMEPGTIYELHLDLWATSNVFKVGHRIRLEVTSSNFPRFDRNTNTGGTIANETEEDFVQAVNRVYHDRAHPSHLLLPIIERR